METTPEVKLDKLPMLKEDRNEAILLWQLHETLLQSYRSLFFTFQAILLTAAGFVAFQIPGEFELDWLHLSVLFALIAIGPVFIIYVWIPIVSHRQKMVSFAQWLLRTNTALDATPFDLMGRFSNEQSPYHQSIVKGNIYQGLLKGPTGVNSNGSSLFIHRSVDSTHPLADIFARVGAGRQQLLLPIPRTVGERLLSGSVLFASSHAYCKQMANRL